MKINEFNQPKQIDESLAGAMFGDVPMSALKGMFTGKGGKHQLAQDIFLRDFYQDAITSLDNGVKSGYVDTKKAYAPQTANTNVDPNANAEPEATPQAKPTSISGKFTQQGAAPQAPLKPTSTNVTFNMPKSANAAPATAAPNQQNPNDQEYKWAPKGMKIGPNTKLSSLGATGNLAESTYRSLNQVFESVVSEMNGEGAETVSITDHMLEWFGLYMDGANWESKKAAIMPLIKKIQDTYNSDKGKGAIKNLARFAYSIAGQGRAIPAGAKNAVQNTAPSSAAPKLTPDQLAAELAAQPPEVQQKVIQQVQRQVQQQKAVK